MKGMKRRHPDETDPSSGLNDHIREWIVARFAMGLTPTQVAKLVNEEFDLSLDRRHVNRYNPTSAAEKRKVAAKWLKLYDDLRAKYLDEVAAIPLAHRNARLAQLQIHHDEAVKNGKTALSLQILEQIAKEVGNVHSNEKRVHHSGRIATEPDRELSIEEMRNLLADRIAESFEHDPVQPTAPAVDTLQ